MNNKDKIIETAMKKLSLFMEDYNNISLKNHQKVLSAFKEAKVSEDCFNSTTGYGYNSYGKEILNKVYSLIFKGEDALVSPHFASGTHAIYTTLKGLMVKRKGLFSLCGPLYDTLHQALTHERGLGYEYQPLKEDGTIDLTFIEEGGLKGQEVVMIQRSRGYATRHAFTVEAIEEAIACIREYAPHVLIFVDNCYGEFVEDREPLEAGADIIAGSLIKNPGGTIAPSGGYVVGKKLLVEEVSFEFSVPGIGQEIGCINGDVLRLLFQGIFQAPRMVAEALYSAAYAGYLFSLLGYEVQPAPEERRGDIVTEIIFNDSQKLIKFCQGIQKYSPVDSYVLPMPWEMPGYDHEVIMASGSFIGGSSSEISADGPLREPYSAYFQGGTSFHYSKIGLDELVQSNEF